MGFLSYPQIVAGPVVPGYYIAAGFAGAVAGTEVAVVVVVDIEAVV